MSGFYYECPHCTKVHPIEERAPVFDPARRCKTCNDAGCVQCMSGSICAECCAADFDDGQECDCDDCHGDDCHGCW